MSKAQEALFRVVQPYLRRSYIVPHCGLPQGRMPQNLKLTHVVAWVFFFFSLNGLCCLAIWPVSSMRRCAHAVAKVGRLWAFCSLPSRPRKRTTACFLVAAIVAWIVLRNARDRYTEQEFRFTHLNEQLAYLRSLYLAREQDVYQMQIKLLYNNYSHLPPEWGRKAWKTITSYSPEVQAILKNCTGMKVKSGLDQKNIDLLQTPFIFQLLPHLLKDPNSLRPAFLLKGERRFVDVVIGVPTVKRDKESYLTTTLAHLVRNLKSEEKPMTLIIVYVGETDLTFVLQTAIKIEHMFPKEVQDGLIEVISPSQAYYPNMETMKPTLGDSKKRFMWRTKHNLDTMYLMAYAQSKGTYYLMLEDDVVAKEDYMTNMKRFTTEVTLSTPQWFLIDFSPNGAIGKMFRTRDLLHFLTYLELFYTNMPVDWLLDSYIADKVCTDVKFAVECKHKKAHVRPMYKSRLFDHIGIYSSLKGKTHKESELGTMPAFYTHINPPLSVIISDIETYKDYTLEKAYLGQNFFWGVKPQQGDTIDFWFLKPTLIERYTIRSGNTDHGKDLLRYGVVEVLPEITKSKNFTVIGTFDEFGLADGEVDPKFGPLKAIRVRVTKDIVTWVIINEIAIRAVSNKKTNTLSKQSPI